MAEAAYYWNLQDGSNWTDPNKAVDGILTNFAYTTINDGYIRCTTTSCGGTDLGTITKVELRVYGYGDGSDRIDLGFFYPTDPTSDYRTTMPTSAGWGAWHDVTGDPFVGGWTWAKIADLFGTTGNRRLWITLDDVQKGNTIYCAKVEIRVTYEPSGPPGKPTQYLAGLDCPNFPHEMDFQSDKLPCPPPYG